MISRETLTQVVKSRKKAQWFCSEYARLEKAGLKIMLAMNVREVEIAASGDDLERDPVYSALKARLIELTAEAKRLETIAHDSQPQMETLQARIDNEAAET